MSRNFDPNHPAFTRALADLRPQLDALASDRLETIRHDVEAAVVLAIGVAPKAMALEAAARAELGEPAAAAFELLERAARACGRAHADHLINLHGADLEEMVGSLSETRSLLLLEAQSLVQRKRMSASLLAELAGGTGYRAMGFDVLQLVGAFRKEWPAIEAHTPVTVLELDQAEALANALVTTLGDNDQAQSQSSPSADLRRRAYTLFVQTYDEVRRAVTFLRWEAGDADEIAPSLSAGRTRKRDADDDAVVLPLVTTPTNGAAPVRAGMPGAPPFVAS